jgi:hypothetical protein
MLTKDKHFHSVKFPPEVLKEAVVRFRSQLPSNVETRRRTLSVRAGNTEWSFDNEEEFYSMYRENEAMEANFNLQVGDASMHLMYFDSGSTNVDITLPTRPQIEGVFEVFEAARDDCFVPPRLRETMIFIGHGRNIQWRDLKDHLHEKHGYEVTAYETGARAGLSITEFLEQAQRNASLALIVHTAEDEDSSGTLHARENVIHETGLFQGKLGFRRAIVLREEGCHEFSNLAGVQEIRFSKGNIRETFGEVLATIKREFNKDETRKSR